MSDLVDSSPYSGQGTSLVVCSALCQWFLDDPWWIVHLWHVPSKKEWKMHHEAHKAMKAAQIPLRLGCRVLFDIIQVAKKVVYYKEWHCEFSVLGNQSRNFLKLVGLNEKPFKPMSIKGGAWSLFLVVGSNYLTARACRAMVSHPPIGKYHLHFHPEELTKCWCPFCSLQTKDHILRVCPRVQHTEDQEPPFSPIEVLKFCKLNDWVFTFPPLNI